MKRCTQDLFRFLRIHALEEKVRAFSNSHGSVVVKAECCQSKTLGSIPAWEVTAFKFFPERQKRVR